MKRIACIIVTYNRKQLLKQCLEAVSSQSFRPAMVYITDNASTDGTMDSVKEWGYYECENNKILYRYILNSKNEGGAGGFYLGMKTAYEDNAYDGFWVMDDDGVPAPDCLEKLVSKMTEYDFLSPLVLSLSDKGKSAFGEERYESIIKTANNGIIVNRANPFNGVLFTRNLICKVGYPKKEMFIWGDEMNYLYRCINNGFTPVTYIEAIHYHPENRQLRVETFLKKKIPVANADWKLYYLIRNYVYNALFVAPGSKTRHLLGAINNIIHYIYYYISQREMKSVLIVIKAAIAGCRKNFSSFN